MKAAAATKPLPIPSPKTAHHLLRHFISYTVACGLAFFLGITFSAYLTKPASPQPTFPRAILVAPSDPPLRGRIGLSEFVSPRGVDHDMTDEELLWRASMVPQAGWLPYRRAGKVAFLFLTRGPLPLAPLWERFFEGHQGLYSVYVHGHPDYNESDPIGSVFHGRRIPSQPVQWGHLNIVDAERRLLANALLDFANERFVLLSEACIPLFDFPTVRSYLINSTTTFVDSYDIPGPNNRGRYDPHMSPVIRLHQWRKGSQWFELDRKLALAIVSDRRYYGAFARNQRKCCADEHYLPTMVTAEHARRNANRSLTWVDWSKAGWHPGRFWRGKVTPELLEQLRSSSQCTYNGRNTTVCFLFARKFLPSSLVRLLRFSKNALGF